MAGKVELEKVFSFIISLVLFDAKKQGGRKTERRERGGLYCLSHNFTQLSPLIISDGNQVDILSRVARLDVVCRQLSRSLCSIG